MRCADRFEFPDGLTLDAVRQLLASASDDVHTQLRVTKGGIAYISSGVTGGRILTACSFAWKPGPRVRGMSAMSRPVMKSG
jgi:hypothetical protein